MCSDFDVVLLASSDSLLPVIERSIQYVGCTRNLMVVHDQGVACMESACHVGVIDHWDLIGGHEVLVETSSLL